MTTVLEQTRLTPPVPSGVVKRTIYVGEREKKEKHKYRLLGGHHRIMTVESVTRVDDKGTQLGEPEIMEKPLDYYRGDIIETDIDLLSPLYNPPNYPPRFQRVDDMEKLEDAQEINEQLRLENERLKAQLNALSGDQPAAGTNPTAPITNMASKPISGALPPDNPVQNAAQQGFDTYKESQIDDMRKTLNELTVDQLLKQAEGAEIDVSDCRKNKAKIVEKLLQEMAS